jgi:hypothetical protein
MTAANEKETPSNDDLYSVKVHADGQITIKIHGPDGSVKLSHDGVQQLIELLKPYRFHRRAATQEND